MHASRMKYPLLHDYLHTCMQACMMMPMTHHWMYTYKLLVICIHIKTCIDMDVKIHKFIMQTEYDYVCVMKWRFGTQSCTQRDRKMDEDMERNSIKHTESDPTSSKEAAEARVAAAVWWSPREVPAGMSTWRSDTPQETRVCHCVLHTSGKHDWRTRDDAADTVYARHVASWAPFKDTAILTSIPLFQGSRTLSYFPSAQSRP